MSTDQYMDMRVRPEVFQNEERLLEEGESLCPRVSIVIPAFNEAVMLRSSLETLHGYMTALNDRYRWELIVVNDGSSDGTDEILKQFASARPGIRVVHHPRNLGLGQALKSGFEVSTGDYVVVLDCDLSYGPEHIEKLLDKIRKDQAKIVVASPYAEGGRVSHVPWLRRTLSKWANRFLATVARCRLSTVTGMARVYDGQFIRSISLRSRGQEISPEIIYKGLLLRAQIDEIPGHLDWKIQRSAGASRTSSMRVVSHIVSTIFSGFLFRPFVFFLLPGLALLLLASYTTIWMFIHFLEAYQALESGWIFARASVAVAHAYQAFPHTFIVAGLSSMLSVQLISLGVLSLQSKQYFEEVFNLGSAIYGQLREGLRENKTLNR